MVGSNSVLDLCFKIQRVSTIFQQPKINYVHPTGGMDILFLLFPPYGVRILWFLLNRKKTILAIFTRLGTHNYWVSFGHCSYKTSRVLASLLLLLAIWFPLILKKIITSVITKLAMYDYWVYSLPDTTFGDCSSIASGVIATKLFHLSP